MQFIYLQVLLKRLKAIKYFLKDKNVPLRKKLIIIGGFIYLMSPIDLIPEPIFIFGIVDDILLWSFIIWYLKSELDKYWVESGPAEPTVKYRGKKIIDDVNFNVEEEIIEEEEEHK
jgi:uncharacterized membrane protein YkvA (DUF1232 family)